MVDVTDSWYVEILVREPKFHPYRLAITSAGSIYCTDIDSDRVWQWSTATGLKPVVENIPDPFNIAADDAGAIWIGGRSERLNLVRRRGPFLHRMLSDGRVEQIDLRAQLARVTDLVYDRSRESIVALDEMTRRISSITTRGDTQILSDSASLSVIRTLGSVRAIAVGTSGEFYVLDFGSTVVEISPDGKKRLRRPMHPALENWKHIDGDMVYHPTLGLLIADLANKKVWRMTEDRFEVIFYAKSGEELKQPTGIAVGVDGTVWLCDPGTGVICRLRPTASH